LNVTVPVAVLGETVAVKITGCSNTDAFTEETRLVVEGTLASWACAQGVVTIIDTSKTASAALAGRQGIREIEPLCCTMPLIENLLNYISVG
jgi:hypothetical protein